MNAKPESEWSIKFKEYLEEECQIDKINAICIVARLHSIMRQYKNTINEEELDGMAWCKAREEYIDDYREPYAEGFKAGCKEILKRL